MIKNGVGSVDGFGREAQEQRLIDVGILRGREARLEVEGVEVVVSGSSKKKRLITCTEGTTGVVMEVGEEARDGNEERVTAVEEVIMQDEGTSGVGE